MTAVDELLAFLRRSLDEDERVAREALHADAVKPGDWITEHHGMGSEPNTCHIAEDRSGHYWSVAHEVYIPNAEHITRWDPARVLAEVAAKRRILDDRDEAVAHAARDFDMVLEGNADALNGVVRLLAQPYAGQPGFREEWRDQG